MVENKVIEDWIQNNYSKYPFNRKETVSPVTGKETVEFEYKDNDTQIIVGQITANDMDYIVTTKVDLHKMKCESFPNMTLDQAKIRLDRYFMLVK